MSDEIFVLLKDHSALTIRREAEKEERSENPVVRGIIDNRLGEVMLGFSHPDDETAERVIRLRTPDVGRARKTLLNLGNIARVSLNRYELVR